MRGFMVLLGLVKCFIVLFTPLCDPGRTVRLAAHPELFIAPAPGWMSFTTDGTSWHDPRSFVLALGALSPMLLQTHKQLALVHEG